jgi:hypothetical protein
MTAVADLVEQVEVAEEQPLMISSPGDDDDVVLSTG